MARAARSLDTLLRQLNRRFPDRSKVSDGGVGDLNHQQRLSDHNPDANGVFHARDFTHDPANGVDIDRLSDELAASRDPRIKYIIANGLILDTRPGFSPYRWIKYSGPNPHNHHLHLSVLPGVGDDPREWNLPMLRMDGDDMAQGFDTVRMDRFGNSNSYGVALDYTEERVVLTMRNVDQLLGLVTQLVGDVAEIKARLEATP